MIETLNGKRSILGLLEVKWYLTVEQTFQVEVIHRSKGTAIKSWEFEASPISEAISYCWYEYVIRTIMQHQIGNKGFPKFLKSTSATEAEELVTMVLEQL